MTEKTNFNIELKKLTYKVAFPNARDFYNILENNRERLDPWFWWTSKGVTPTFTKTVLFMTAYILDTKRKKLMHFFKQAKSYDEQFFIFNNGNIAGMIGLDNIHKIQQDAEIWYFVTKENEGQGVATAALKKLQDYAFGKKQLNEIYAKTASGNTGSESLMVRNNYQIKTIEYGVPTSKRNPKITDLTTWFKQK